MRVTRHRPRQDHHAVGSMLIFSEWTFFYSYVFQFQIRVEGYKGVIAVDRRLDGTTTKMRLRPSMKKFESLDPEKPIELQLVACLGRWKPVSSNKYENNDLLSLCFVNLPSRQLITALEGKGVDYKDIQTLQDEAIAASLRVLDGDDDFLPFLRTHSLGSSYRLCWLLEMLKTRFGLTQAVGATNGIENRFIERLREVSRQDALCDIKYNAKFVLPNSYKVVGVVDEGELVVRPN